MALPGLFSYLFYYFWICRAPLTLGVWEGLRFVIVALPGLLDDKRETYICAVQSSHICDPLHSTSLKEIQHTLLILKKKNKKQTNKKKNKKKKKKNKKKKQKKKNKKKKKKTEMNK